MAFTMILRGKCSRLYYRYFSPTFKVTRSRFEPVSSNSGRFTTLSAFWLLSIGRKNHSCLLCLASIATNPSSEMELSTCLMECSQISILVFKSWCIYMCVRYLWSFLKTRARICYFAKRLLSVILSSLWKISRVGSCGTYTPLRGPSLSH